MVRELLNALATSLASADSLRVGDYTSVLTGGGLWASSVHAYPQYKTHVICQRFESFSPRSTWILYVSYRIRRASPCQVMCNG